ncbi:hypothetical protein P4H65_24135 [Paenibacillus chitinolyticus]|uniref:hypothetical protein n=1 Tax=Paenibacillus chitinolyticus TaxID=79263 RepID=UPI002DBD37FE|nr:hypothetical protein [Paenibacillus chitinolyticus]MEC0248886.1 hypothetical protein [Paenibacillus chitinolyticus]
MEPVIPKCPRCDSKKVTEIGKVLWALIFFAIGGFLLLVGIFVWPLLVIGLLLIIASPFIGVFVPKVNNAGSVSTVGKANKQKTPLRAEFRNFLGFIFLKKYLH